MLRSGHGIKRREGRNRKRTDSDELRGRGEGDLLRRDTDRDAKGGACFRCTIQYRTIKYQAPPNAVPASVVLLSQPSRLMLYY